MLSLAFLAAAPALASTAIVPEGTRGALALRVVIVEACEARPEPSAREPGSAPAVSCGGAVKAPFAVHLTRGVDARDRIVTIRF
jgi:hypothetical protein